MTQQVPQTRARSDAERMADVCAGQKAALQELYDLYFSRGYGLALRMLSDPATAEDCVHDIFLKVWQKPQLYDSARGAFQSWFLTTVHNNAANYLRRRGRTVPLESAPDADGEQISHEPTDRPAGGSSVEDLYGQSEAQQVVRTALAELNSRQRHALELAYFGGMSQSEIAEHLQEPLGTVKTRIRGGMIKLRAALEALGWNDHLTTGQGYER